MLELTASLGWGLAAYSTLKAIGLSRSVLRLQHAVAISAVEDGLKNGTTYQQFCEITKRANFPSEKFRLAVVALYGQGLSQVENSGD